MKVLDNGKVILRTYNRIWKYERKIYALDNVRLPIPINPGEAVYFIIGLFITIFLLKILTFLNVIPFILRYTLLPYGLMKFLTKKKFDGKLPHMFLKGYFEYIQLPKVISRFQPGEVYKGGQFTQVIYRGKEIINVTETLMKKGGKKSGIRLSN